ncbi:MAG: 50S ribosomal protein L25/general stress protein Ctc [Gammaproteobacteria bacterium]|nr:MAG: 50S ribosomal protein L25/general stress protein Ctc [Gammaproteobacteria bacterium]
MKEAFELKAQPRESVGKGPSRRLRRAKRVPAILYGGKKPPMPLALDQASVLKQLENEAFYSHILTLHIGDEKEQVILKEMQRHPVKPIVLHIDFLRVSAGEVIHVHVPLHFIGEDVAPGVKAQGGIVSHLLTEVEVSCLPKDLPEYIEVDVSHLHVGETIHLSEIPLPPNVKLVTHGEQDLPVVTILAPKGGAAEATEETASE